MIAKTHGVSGNPEAKLKSDNGMSAEAPLDWAYYTTILDSVYQVLDAAFCSFEDFFDFRVQSSCHFVESKVRSVKLEE